MSRARFTTGPNGPRPADPPRYGAHDTDKSDFHDTRKRIRKRFPDEPVAEEAHELKGSLMAVRDLFRINNFNVMIDALVSALQQRLSKYIYIEERFDIFHKWWKVDDNTVATAAVKLQSIYNTDLEEFDDEFLQIKHFFTRDNITDETSLYLANMLKRLMPVRSTFPNVVNALRLYLTLPSSNASGERSFSCMKRIKNYLRFTLSQDLLDALALLAIESDLTRSLDFTDIIETFANAKECKTFI